MARGALEQWFEAYRSRSDFEALARVFDALAPNMLALARHLAPDAASAEDLVQATFLAAIEQREHFDAERDLASWLNGILTNKARLARILRTREVEPDRLQEREELDPALDAELREFVAALDAALQRVPENYRAVLRGHLADGKRTEQLARELGVVPGTVRVQLHRGLAILRKLLPPSFALGLVASLAPRGHAAMRGEILCQAKLAAGALRLSTPWLIGGALLNVKMILPCAGLVAGLGGWLWYSSSIRSVEPILPSQPTADTAQALPRIATPEEPAITRSAVEPELALPSTETGPYGALDVEIVWHDGTPASDVELELTPRDELVPGHALVTLRTDAKGHALAARLHEGRISIAVDRAESVASDAKVVRGASTPYRLELPRGVDVDGHVVDAERRPVSGALVWVNGRRPTNPSVPASASAITGDDGAFSIRSVNREASISATSATLGCTSPQPVTSDMRATHSSVELVLRNVSGSIEGTVRTSAGVPVARARVAVKPWRESGAKDSDPSPASLRTTTDDSGHYAFAAVRPSGKVLVIALANGEPTANMAFPLAAGEAKRLDLTLPRGVTVHGTVTDAAGAPLADVAIYDRDSESGSPLREGLRNLYSKSDASGHFEIKALDPGQLMLSAQTKIDGIERQLTTKIDAVDGSNHEWNPAFADGLSIFGTVRDRAGAPLEGWIVNALPQDFEEPLLPLPATTDAQGAFKIRNLRSASYAVRLTLPDKRSIVTQREGVKPGPTPIELVVAVPSKGDCFVHGRVVAPDGTAVAGAKVLVRTTAPGNLRRGDTALDGTFRLQAPQFGAQVVSIDSPVAPRLEIEIENLEGGEDLDLGDILLRGGGSLELSLVLHDGSSLQRPMVILEGHGMLQSQDGRQFVSENLPPGRYEIFLVAENASSRSVAFEVRANEVTREKVELEPGLRRTFWFMGKEAAAMMGKSRIVVRKTNGDVVLDVRRELAGSFPGCVGSFSVGLPAGSYRIEATAEDGRSATQRFDVAEGDEASKSLHVELGN